MEWLYHRAVFQCRFAPDQSSPVAVKCVIPVLCGKRMRFCFFSNFGLRQRNARIYVAGAVLVWRLLRKILRLRMRRGIALFASSSGVIPLTAGDVAGRRWSGCVEGVGAGYVGEERHQTLAFGSWCRGKLCIVMALLARFRLLGHVAPDVAAVFWCGFLPCRLCFCYFPTQPFDAFRT